MKFHPALAFAMAASALLPRPAHGQARSLDIDPSVRAAGMGGASTAVCWSGNVDDWANPALLGYGAGMAYRWSRVRLVPDFTDDVSFSSHRFEYGWGGFGISGGDLTLNYGEIELTDPVGTPLGVFVPTERIRPLAAGISLARVIGTFASLSGGEVPRFARRADLAFGVASRSVGLNLAPSSYQGSAKAEVTDVGLVVRASPLPEGGPGRLSVDLAYGFAALNVSGASVSFVGEDRADYLARHYRNGFAARVALSPSHDPFGASGRGLFGLIRQGMRPLAAVAVAAHFSHIVRSAGSVASHDVNGLGIEAELANVLALRAGHVSDRSAGIDGYSWGLGLGLPLGDLAGLRYDFASSPQAAGYRHLHRQGVMTWLDLAAAARR